jgi:hypothetical protein
MYMEGSVTQQASYRPKVIGKIRIAANKLIPLVQ